MKFLHLGDLHLGKSLLDYDLIEDQKYILNQILTIAQKEGIDAMLIAGDVYDRAIPSEAAINLLDDFLNRLAVLGIQTFLISGNHDSDDRLHFGSRLFEKSGIYICAKFTGQLSRYTLTDMFGEVDIWLLPFVKASHVRYFFPDEEISSYEDAVRVILQAAGIDKTRRNILVAHQFVAGKNAEDPLLGGSESAGTQSVGLVEKIGYDCFDDFDYAALGHIHSPQQIGREQVRYAGSPLKYSLSEALSDKSVPIITLGKKGDVRISLHPLKPRRDLRHLKGEMKLLLAKEHVQDPDDYIYATLTDEDVIPGAMGIFQQIYPNTLKIDYDNSHTKETEQIDLTAIEKSRNFDELISDFYRQMYGCEISPEELAVMQQAAQEAGVIHETD